MNSDEFFAHLEYLTWTQPRAVANKFAVDWLASVDNPLQRMQWLPRAAVILACEWQRLSHDVDRVRAGS